MKAHTRKKAISGRGVRGTSSKARSKSKLEKVSGTQPKASSRNRPATPGTEPHNSASAGRKQKAGDKPPPGSPSVDPKVRLGAPSGHAAARFPIVGIGASAG